MEIVLASVIAVLTIGYLLEQLGFFAAPTQAPPQAVPPVDTGAGRAERRPDPQPKRQAEGLDQADAQLIGEVLSHLDERQAEVRNIFAEELGGMRPRSESVMLEPPPVSDLAGTGKTVRIDVDALLKDRTRRPVLIRGFDTDRDRVLLVTSLPDDDEVSLLPKGRTGAELILGGRRVAILKDVCGRAPIDALVIDAQ